MLQIVLSHDLYRKPHLHVHVYVYTVAQMFRFHRLKWNGPFHSIPFHSVPLCSVLHIIYIYIYIYVS